jgi:transformation/transcription domain-associated protein
MRCLINTLVNDYEENGVTCLKIIVDLHKNYSALMEEFVQPFLEIVKEMYINIPNLVHQVFSEVRVLCNRRIM